MQSPQAVSPYSRLIGSYNFDVTTTWVRRSTFSGAFNVRVLLVYAVYIRVSPCIETNMTMQLVASS